MNNTLRGYIVNYIKLALDLRCSSYNKLYRELSNKIEEIIKLAVSEVKHYNTSLEDIYQQLKSNKKSLHALSKLELLNFLDAHQVKKEIVDEFNKHSLNKRDLELESLMDKINDIVLVQKTEEGEELNIAKILAHTIPLPDISRKRLKVFEEAQ